MRAHELLFEIGAEEIPAGLLAQALPALGGLLEERLRAARLAFDTVATVGAPRRLAAHVTALAERQEDVSEVVTGPPAKIAYAPDGTPTRAAQAFADKYGVPVAALERRKTDKGEYVALARSERGAEARALLPALLEGVIAALPWKKSMRWGAHAEAFVRPVHWILAVYGGEVVPVRFAGVASGRETRGHRFLAPGPIAVDGHEAYVQALRAAHVLVDPRERRARIEAELARVAEEEGAVLRPDEALLEEVTNLVEFPVGVAGGFDEVFLEVPEPVIVSAMRTHQRYFALEREGRLAPRFATVAGTVVRDVSEVSRGNERVLRARLADARFFFDEDRKVRLEDRAARLDGVVFQAKLGSVGEKALRLVGLGTALAPRFGADVAECVRAARLLKADLVTLMVGEFPDLQGVMGEAYARLQGEREVVARAIREHYLPRGARDELPRTEVGAVCALADRLDTLAGCFGVGLAPTGSADPFALRRAALGLLAVLLDRGVDVDVCDLIELALAEYGKQGKTLADDTSRQLEEFLRVRERGVLADLLPAEVPREVVDAAMGAELGAGHRRPVRSRARAQALAELARTPEFAPLGIAFKRVANILKGTQPEGAPDPARFEHEAERALHHAASQAGATVRALTERHDYATALRALAELKTPVDAFFDAVLVMAEDPTIRDNRLRLLGELNALFTRVADFRQLALG